MNIQSSFRGGPISHVSLFIDDSNIESISPKCPRLYKLQGSAIFYSDKRFPSRKFYDPIFVESSVEKTIKHISNSRRSIRCYHSIA